MNEHYIGKLYGMNVFEDNGVQIGPIYPSGKKDGNKLGRRKKLLKHSGCIFYSGLDKVIVIHPSKKNLLIESLNKSTSTTPPFLQKNAVALAKAFFCRLSV